MDKITYLAIGGYFYSGSSAVVDLLKEYRGFYESGSEIRIINDPYGLIQLERALIEDWNWIRAAMAIEDFINYCKKCARTKSYFPLAPFGMGYKDKLNHKFIEITLEYIENLTDFKFDADFYAFKAKDSYLKYVINRCRAGIEKYSGGRLKWHSKRMLNYSHPTKDYFDEVTKNYFDKIFMDTISDTTKFIILDQAIHPRDSYIIKKYFYNGKMIIVDRDPRDIFIDSVINGGLSYENSKKQGIEFCKLQLSQREHQQDNEYVLSLKFEDLILNYKATCNTIESFLNISNSTHEYINRYFKPEKSAKNIGIWKKYYQDYNLSLDTISELMENYLYN